MVRYIDADKLLEELQEEIEFESPMYSEERNRWFTLGLKCAVRDVKHQPIADVAEVKRGRWIGEALTCSICGRNISEIYDADSYMSYGVEDELRYCPYCGAKMDGGAE